MLAFAVIVLQVIKRGANLYQLSFWHHEDTRGKEEIVTINPERDVCTKFIAIHKFVIQGLNIYINLKETNVNFIAARYQRWGDHQSHYSSILLLHLGTMKTCKKFNSNPSNTTSDIQIFQCVDLPTNTTTHRAVLHGFKNMWDVGFFV